MEREFAEMAYERMMRIRLFEMKMHEMIAQKDSPFVGIMHSQVGEEGYAVALIPQLRKDDYLSTTYRCHAHVIARGMSLEGLAAEVCAKKEGVCRGRAGNMHVVDQDLNIIAGFGIIGAGLPSTVGTAFASKYKGLDQVSVAFFGDGACGQGTFHESLNLASSMELPVLFVNNNNHYAMSTPTKHTIAASSTTEYAKAHQIPCEQADGMDFFAAYEAAKRGIDYVREHGKPYYIEYDCFRFHGQWEGDPQTYKDPDETKSYWERDPVMLFRRGSIERALLSENEMDAIDKKVAVEVEHAIAFGKAGEEPGFEDIMTDIYADRY